MYGHKVDIFTDHSALKFLFSEKNTVPRISRWALLLSEFDYTIFHTKGSENYIPDALSRPVATITERKTFVPAEIFRASTIRPAQLAQPDLALIINALEKKKLEN